jgi:hypothetical protein
MSLPLGRPIERAYSPQPVRSISTEGVLYVDINVTLFYIVVYVAASRFGSLHITIE